MNAKELTERYYEDHQELKEIEKRIEYISQEVEKIRTILNDATIDIKMLQRR